MKFVLFSHIFPPAVDGGSSHLYSIGRTLKNRGHQVIFFSSNCTSTDDFINPKSISLPISGYRLPIYKSLYRPIKPFSQVIAKGPIIKLIPLYITLKKIIAYKPDFIIAGPYPTTISLYALLFKYLIGCRLVIVPCFHPQDPLFSSHLLKFVSQKADRIFTLTDSEKKYFNPSKTSTIPSGVPKGFLIKNQPKFPQKPNILFVGSLSAHKGVETLIRALPPNCTLTIAGKKTLYYSRIRHLIESNPDINIFFDFKNNQLKSLIDACSCLVLPSIHESFGKVLIEAWSRKKPTISSDIPALKHLVRQSGGGLLFPLNDSMALKKQLSRLISNQELSLCLGSSGFNFVKNNLTWDKIGEKLCQNFCL